MGVVTTNAFNQPTPETNRPSLPRPRHQMPLYGHFHAHLHGIRPPSPSYQGYKSTPISFMMLGCLSLSAISQENAEVCRTYTPNHQQCLQSKTVSFTAPLTRIIPSMILAYDRSVLLLENTLAVCRSPGDVRNFTGILQDLFVDVYR